MHRTIRFVSIALLSGSLFGCMNQLEPDVQANDGLNNDSSANNPDLVLGDDGLIAPDAPSLSIAASPGLLNFNWVDRQNAQDSNRVIKLYQYNSRTELETEVDAVIDPATQSHALPIVPHRVAWDALSYRLEICAQLNCLSSQRVPINGLLINAISGITAPTTALSDSFADDLAINSRGNVALVTSPSNSSASVFFHLDRQWVYATTLSSNNFTDTSESSMRVAVSASGDTIAIATLSESLGPVVVIFDRLGENWIETAAITPLNSNALTQAWNTDSISIQLSDDGDRLLFGAQPATRSFITFDDRHNQLQIFDRNTISWALSASLTIPAQYTRLHAASASDKINTVVALSALDNRLYLHEYALSGNTWRETSTQLLDSINPSSDTEIISSAGATHIVVAGWEQEFDGRGSVVAWKFEKRPAGWVARDSIKMPPTAERSATLRLAADAQLQTLAVGWQAQNDANLAFYKKQDERWSHQFSVPESLNLNRKVALVQSVVISKHNAAALIGTPNTGNGGMFSSFH